MLRKLRLAYSFLQFMLHKLHLAYSFSKVMLLKLRFAFGFCKVMLRKSRLRQSFYAFMRDVDLVEAIGDVSCRSRRLERQPDPMAFRSGLGFNRIRIVAGASR